MNATLGEREREAMWLKNVAEKRFHCQYGSRRKARHKCVYVLKALSLLEFVAHY